MPKDSGRQEMPATVARSDAKARRTWVKTHDRAVETYGEGEAAHRTAFAALKHSYRKEGGRWVAKGTLGPSDAQARRGPETARRSTDEPRAATRGGGVEGEERSRAALYAEAKALGIRGRSGMSKMELAEAVAAARG